MWFSEKRQIRGKNEKRRNRKVAPCAGLKLEGNIIEITRHEVLARRLEAALTVFMGHPPLNNFILLS